MELRIDAAGRIEIPEEIRNRLKLQPDTVIELEESDEVLVIRRSGASPSPLIEEEGLLVHTGTPPTGFDWSGFIEAVREERIRDLAGK